ncbi:MAG: DUF1385 domain-containing protein [Christensenellaceae bacterium]|jgi:uncharacterized protein YqhQ
MKKTNIGGQAVLEGVMMRSEKAMAIAVRREDGNIVTDSKENNPLHKKYKILKFPIIRGVVNFVEMLVSGVKTITDAAKLYDPEIAEEEEPSKFEKFVAKKTGKDPLDVAMVFAVVIALVLAVGMFYVLPNLLTGWITPHITDAPILKNLIDGGIRVAIFIVYLLIITRMGEIKRLFGYHGAEHKTINCYEHEDPLDVEHVKKHSRLHPRCGTSFMLIVMIISILLFSLLLGWNDEHPVTRILLRLALLPLVAGVSYEVLKLLARADNVLVRAIRKPGMALQRITTREPDDGMIEAAIIAFRLAEGEMSAEEIEELQKSFYRENPTGKAAKTEEQKQDIVEETE